MQFSSKQITLEQDGTEKWIYKLYSMQRKLQIIQYLQLKFLYLTYNHVSLNISHPAPSNCTKLTAPIKFIYIIQGITIQCMWTRA